MIPESVTSIAEGAFSGCGHLTKIYLASSTPPTLGIDAFASLQDNAKFYCPIQSENSYKAAANWNTYASRITVDAIASYFMINSKANKAFFISKDKLKSIVSDSSSFADFKKRVEEL
jgi:hypothetical protein